KVTNLDITNIYNIGSRLGKYDSVLYYMNTYCDKTEFTKWKTSSERAERDHGCFLEYKACLHLCLKQFSEAKSLFGDTDTTAIYLIESWMGENNPIPKDQQQLWLGYANSLRQG